MEITQHEKVGELHYFHHSMDSNRGRRGDCVDYALAALSGIPPAEWTDLLLDEFNQRRGTYKHAYHTILTKYMDAEEINLAEIFRNDTMVNECKIYGNYGGSNYRNALFPTVTQLFKSGLLTDGKYFICNRNHAAALEVRDGIWYMTDNGQRRPVRWVRKTVVYEKTVDYCYWTERRITRKARKHYYPVFGARVRISNLYRVP